nr:immunoglobulin heavy chain junction region [Macaca mulatta]MOW25962.1 immunoglobulin heavy chain junction region [Macaca mulatta]
CARDCRYSGYSYPFYYYGLDSW